MEDTVEKGDQINESDPLILYFNINYYCNNRCIFCASNSTSASIKGRKSITSKDFYDIVNRFKDFRTLSVIINGGEPTLNKSIIDMLCITKDFNINCTLFTNGRLLSDPKIARSLLKSFKGTVSIPLYSASWRLHDALTRTKNSFNETLRGIYNFFRLRSRYNLPLKLILKLLFMEPLLEENVNLAEFIIKTFPQTDTISMNSLIHSNAVKRSEKLIPCRDELKKSINNVLSTIKNSDFDPSKISVVNIPLCLIRKENECFIGSNPVSNETVVYFDPFGCSICDHDFVYSKKPICKKCGLRLGYYSNKTITNKCPFN